MKRKEPVITVDEMRAAIEEAYRDSGGDGVIPKDYFTEASFAQLKELTIGESKTRLNRLVKERGWKRVKMLGPTMGGRMSRQWYFYKPKKESSDAKLDRSKRSVSV